MSDNSERIHQAITAGGSGKIQNIVVVRNNTHLSAYDRWSKLKALADIICTI